MKIGKTVKKLVMVAAAMGIACVIFSHISYAQLVETRAVWRQDFISSEYRPRWPAPSENLGRYDMRRYPRATNLGSSNPVNRGTISPVTYDPFGNFLLPGGEIYNIVWDRSRIGASQWQNDSWAWNIFNNLMICADEMSNSDTVHTGEYVSWFYSRKGLWYAGIFYTVHIEADQLFRCEMGCIFT